METIIRVKPSELNQEFIDKVKAFFKDEDTIEISFSSVSDFGLIKKETPEEYKKRINKAIKNLGEKKNIVKISEQEFESLVKELKVKR